MEDRRFFHLFMYLLLVFVPINIYIIGNWMGCGIQWVFFRYQQTYLGQSFIPVTQDILYVLNGTIGGKTALSLTFWIIGALIIFVSIIIVIINYRADFGSFLVPAVSFSAGIFAIILGTIVQYGIAFHAPAGTCIPVGIPLYIGYCLWTMSTERGNLTRETLKCQWQVFRHFLQKAGPLLLIICIFILYTTTTTGLFMPRDTIPTAILPYTILQHHTLVFDSVSSSPLLNYNGTTSYAIREINGHYYSVLPVVTPILLVPFYTIQFVLLNVFAIPVTDEIIIHSAKIAAASMATLSCIIFFVSARYLLEERTALISTAILAFATNTWSISSQALWQHGLGELLLISMIYLIIKNETADSPLYLALLGIFSGLFVFNRPIDAILIIPVIVYVVIWHRKKILNFLIPAVLAGFPFFLYNQLLFGSPLGGYVQNTVWFFFGGQSIVNFLGLLLSPNKGLLIYSPVLILAVFGFMVIRNDTSRTYISVIKFFGIAVLGQIMIYSVYKDWMGGFGFGPRYLTDALPVLVLFCGFFLAWLGKVPWPSYRKQMIAVFVAILVLVSIMVQVIGVFYFPFLKDSSLVYPDSATVWDLQRSQILSSYRDGSEGIRSLKIIELPPFEPIIDLNFRIHRQPS